MILMVGFPGSGKTHWAKNYTNQHPEKHYKLLSIDELIACMTTNVERDIKLRQASKCLTEIIKIAAERPGNYILDQCNILFSARQYKLQLFIGFRRMVMVIFPSKEEWNKRLSKHQMSEGEHIPQAAFLKLQVSCTLPEQENLIDELHYVELSQQQAQTLLQEYKNEARRLLPPAPKYDKNPPRYKQKSYPYCPSFSYKTQYTDQNGKTNHNREMFTIIHTLIFTICLFRLDQSTVMEPVATFLACHLSARVLQQQQSSQLLQLPELLLRYSAAQCF